MGNKLELEQLKQQYRRLEQHNMELMCTLCNQQTIEDPVGALLLTAVQVENEELRRLLSELIELELDESDRSFDEEDADKFSSLVDQARKLLKNLKENPNEA